MLKKRKIEATDEKSPKKHKIATDGIDVPDNNSAEPNSNEKFHEILEKIYENGTAGVDENYDKEQFMAWLFTQKVKFDLFKNRICDETLKSIKEMNLKYITEIQLRTIPAIMAQVDVIGIAKTGSGKTLAFLIAIVQRLFSLKIKPKHGTCCIILVPTRELAVQISEVLKNLLKYHSITYGMVIGGTKLKTEAQTLLKGINILIATPGRLLDHLENTKEFKYNNLKCLVIDEVDRILDCGFEETMKKLLQKLPKEGRQTLMFTATKSTKVSRMEVLALKKNPVCIDVDCDKKESTVNTLEQTFAICPPDKRLLFLYKLLKMLKDKKVMVFFSTTTSVKFHYKFFKALSIPLDIMQLHGKKKQTSRTNTYLTFCNAAKGILFCTDVAARGLDIAEVDYILQYDPPTSPEEYIHRVGRTARGENKTGNAMLILLPEETKFIEKLNEARIPITEYIIPWEKLKDVQNDMIDYISENYELSSLGIEAFKQYIKDYRTKSSKVFIFKEINLKKLALSFGIKEISPDLKSFIMSFTVHKL